MDDVADDPHTLCRILSQVVSEQGKQLPMSTEAQLKKAGLIRRADGKVLLTDAGREQLRQLTALMQTPADPR